MLPFTPMTLPFGCTLTERSMYPPLPSPTHPSNPGHLSSTRVTLPRCMTPFPGLEQMTRLVILCLPPQELATRTGRPRPSSLRPLSTAAKFRRVSRPSIPQELTLHPVNPPRLRQTSTRLPLSLQAWRPETVLTWCRWLPNWLTQAPSLSQAPRPSLTATSRVEALVTLLIVRRVRMFDGSDVPKVRSLRPNPS